MVTCKVVFIVRIVILFIRIGTGGTGGMYSLPTIQLCVMAMLHTDYLLVVNCSQELINWVNRNKVMCK